MKAFSEEWAQNYKERINSNKEFPSIAQNWNWPLILSMTCTDSEKLVFMNLKNGVCTEARLASDADIETAEFIINANMESWQEILCRSLDPMMAVMTMDSKYSRIVDLRNSNLFFSSNLRSV